ncbi:Sdd2p KNAG_0C05770 [Huiozyma naganishii CBS 8797]|uniref:Programmed cell death protein 5 n=1 Tax=Huiozyma naganishii (strain ATCC MYA-139 / BCRC 22969 / CBS 8797 / KCTC 17520 / NBRC 10181 / NCYC 3082 / Yp74L-3) TaxID=1071383 RepID=J7R4A3_HUIN7|nr:hypothetical protein KNAG_0C05770 [Kazachstania naganishii CBS 8797]CCK69675.1 hypothetical protein KNAG_0C05770 [Kazachstania naganishii CBS 8797]
MDAELQALREARLAQLKSSAGQNASGSDAGAGAGGPNGGNPGADASAGTVNPALVRFLQPQALERLSRVSLVRPDRVKSVELYLQQLISTGQLNYKINENEIVQILNGIARQENKRNDQKIIFERKDMDLKELEGDNHKEDDSEDDFFDE